jgi:hypothetical protein
MSNHQENWKRRFLAGALFCMVVGSHATGEAREPDAIRIPLVIVNIGEPDDPVLKVGIRVGLGGGPPLLYEFDTGGGGFWAASGPAGRDWWGGFEELPGTSLHVSYTSGNTYEAAVARTTVEFYALTGGKPIYATPPVFVSRIRQFENTKKARATAEWQSALASGHPPLFHNFYGDFGVAPKSSPAEAASERNGAFHVFGQVRPPEGRTSGYIVHIAGDGAESASYVQVGFTEGEKATFRSQFKMTPGHATFPTTGLSTYANQMVAEVEVDEGGRREVYPDIPVVVDTGATHASIHQGREIMVPRHFLAQRRNGKRRRSQDFEHGSLLLPGAVVRLRGENAVVGGDEVFAFRAKEAPHLTSISVGPPKDKDGKDGSRFNTGLLIFFEYDVLFDMENGVIGFRRHG